MPNWCHNVIDVRSTPEQVANIRKLIIRDGVVDFNIVVPMPLELNGVYTFNEDTLSLDLCQTNPDRVGTNIISTLNDEDIPKLQIVLDDPDIDVDATVEDNIKRIFDKNAVDMFAGIPKANLSWAWRTKITPSLAALIDYVQSDHAIWCNEEFGEPDWYMWRTWNWGCKWNASETEINTDTNGSDPTYCQVQFDTPWAPPRRWFEELCKLVDDSIATVEMYMEYAEPGDGYGGRLERTSAGEEVEFDAFDQSQLSEFLYGDADYIANEDALAAWENAPHDFEDEVLLDDEFDDSKFTDEELESDD